MTGDNDRMARAGDFVLGRMNEAERERAQKDLERDPAFRDAVIRLAERLRSHGLGSGAQTASLWRLVESDIASMPQMKAAPIAAAATATPGPAPAAAHALGGWRGALLAACLAAACGVGFVAGRLAAEPEAPVRLTVLEDGGGQAIGLVEGLASGTLRFRPLVAIEAAGGKTPMLWAIRDDGSVAALGPLDSHLPTDIGAGPAPGSRYRVTMEDASTDLSAPKGSLLAEGAAITLPAGD